MSDTLAASSSLLTSGPIAPAWVIIPLALATLVVVASHVLLISRAEMPPVRKRLRTVNGVLMMFTIPLVAYAFGIASPQRPRLFVMVWVIVAGLVLLVLLLAIADIFNTILMNRAERAELRRQVAIARATMRQLGTAGQTLPPNP